jgi:protein ImuB
MAIWLPRLAIDRWRYAEHCERGAGADAAPVALIEEAAHGPRIAAANDAGLAAGARPGMRLTDARTLCPALKIVPGDPQGDLAFLQRLGVWARRWGPWTALDAPDGLLVDVGGTAHLFGGEGRLLADARRCLARQGLTVRLAIAPTAGAAWALAHYGPERAILASPSTRSALRAGRSDPEPRNAENEGIADALADLPVAALRLDGELLLVLRRLGLKRIGDLARVGRDALHRRFRQHSPERNPLVRLDQLLGRAPEPLLPLVAPQAAWVQRRLLEPVRHREWLGLIVADLAEDMARELETRGEGARRLELGLWRVDGDVAMRSVELAAATRDPAHIARLFQARLDAIEAGFGIELVRMRAVWTEPLRPGQADLDTRIELPGTTLAECLDRLSVRLGAGAVRRPAAHASHLPERAQKWQAPLEPESPSQKLFGFHGRPLKLLDRPEKIAVLYATPDGDPHRFSWRGRVHEIARVEGPERIAPEWWREKSSTRLRDYYRIEDSEGRRYWIYRAGLAGDGRGGLPDWFLQGLYG